MRPAAQAPVADVVGPAASSTSVVLDQDIAPGAGSPSFQASGTTARPRASAVPRIEVMRPASPWPGALRAAGRAPVDARKARDPRLVVRVEPEQTHPAVVRSRQVDDQCGLMQDPQLPAHRRPAQPDLAGEGRWPHGVVREKLNDVQPCRIGKERDPDTVPPGHPRSVAAPTSLRLTAASVVPVDWNEAEPGHPRRSVAAQCAAAAPVVPLDWNDTEPGPGNACPLAWC